MGELFFARKARVVDVDVKVRIETVVVTAHGHDFFFAPDGNRAGESVLVFVEDAVLCFDVGAVDLDVELLVTGVHEDV